MNRMQKTTRLAVFLAFALILVGCSTPTVVALPTQDIPSIRTEAVKTVEAKLTIEAVLQPTATLPPTLAPVVVVITATPLPTPTAEAVVLVPTSTPTVKPASGGGGVVYPTATTRSGPDLAQLLSQSPIDGTNVSAGSEFDGTWTFKNVGTSTWTTGYEYRFAGGTNLAKKSIYTLQEVSLSR